MAEKRRWPKLEPGQQIRIKNIKTGLYAYKPKGSSVGWYWHEGGKATVWDNFSGPGHIIGQLARGTADNVVSWRKPQCATKAEDVEIQIVELSVVKTINAEEQMEERRAILAEQEDRRNYRGWNDMPYDSMLYHLYRSKSHDAFLKIVEPHLDSLRFKFGNKIHKDDIKELENRILSSL